MRARLLVPGFAIALAACELALPIHETPSGDGAATSPDGGDDATTPAVDSGVDGAPASNAHLIFSSDFAGVTFGAPTCGGGNCDEAMSGGTPPFTPSFWSGSGAMQLLVDPQGTGISAGNIGTHMENDIANDADPSHGAVLHQTVTNGLYDGYTYNTGGASIADQGDLYVTHTMKLAQDLGAQVGGAGLRQFLSFFQDNQVLFSVFVLGGAQPRWNLRGGGQGGAIDWAKDGALGDSIPPANTWFKIELWWHPAMDASGVVWLAINGKKVAEYDGRNLFSTHALDQIELLVDTASTLPSEQWIDDLELWDGLPSSATR